jgi:hypothetical protein
VRSLEGDEWAAYFRGFRISAFRLETQPTYTMPAEQPNVARFLAGELPPEGHNAAWHKTIADHAAAGRTMSRVRTLTRPLTDYQRYGFTWSIPGNLAAGEDVRILDLTGREDFDPGITVPGQDWWLFDDAAVVHLNFRPDGALSGRELIEDPDLGEYRRIRDLALASSVPFAEYVAEHPA